MRTIYISPPPNQDALDHAVGEWDMDRVPHHSDPLVQMLIEQDESDEADLLIEQYTAWQHVTPIHEYEM